MEHREPLEFAVGDTLTFQKYFECYLPSDGWSLLYEIRSDQNATDQAIEFFSTADVTNTLHEISVAAAITTGWLPDPVAVLVGYAVNAGAGTRHMIYQGALNLLPNLGTAKNDTIVKTFAQQQIELLQKALANLNAHTLNQSTVQEVELRREKRKEIRMELNFWEERRANEVAVENVANGRPSGNKHKPVYNIIQSGTPFRGQSPFIPNS